MNDLAPGSAGPAAAPVTAGQHAVIPHTADAGFTAVAPTLAGLFLEAGLALAELTADVAAETEPDAWAEIDLAAADLSGLAFAWLNALIAESEIARAAVVSIDDPELTPPTGAQDTWRLRTRVGLGAYGRPGVRVRRPPKSATFHGLTVEPSVDGWAMTAYLDI